MTAHHSTSARKNRVRLGVQALEARDVPAASVLDLGTQGAQALAGEAIVRQTEAVSVANRFRTFLRLKDNGNQAGFNSDARPHQMDQTGGLGTTHALKLSKVPTVVIGGVTYREFLLDVNQKSNQSDVSLDELRLFAGNNRNLRGYDADTHTLGGKSAIFDIDQAGDVSVRLNGGLNGGPRKGDAVVLVPDAAFGGQKYVFLFSQFSGANGGAEEWGVHRGGAFTAPGTAPPPAPVPTTGSLSGSVYADMNGNGTWEPNGTQADPVEEYVLSGVTVQLYSTNAAGESTFVTDTTTDANGNYTFAGLQAGNYTIVVVHPEWFIPGVVTEYSVDLGTGTNGTGYNFGELPYIEAN